MPVRERSLRNATMVVAMVSAVTAVGCGRTQASIAGAGTSPGTATTDSVRRSNDAQVRAILARIAGRENEPAAQVFTNVKILPQVPASTFLTIMNIGYAGALGVRCSHCHVPGNFASDEKRPKRAAREMAVMHRSINQQLAQMTELGSPNVEDRYINCTTCHRGMVNPRNPR